ncbi:hypothetical protein SCLCIDRAFT_1212153 [Scleroderma citrinum Foug A]|uniref:Uncharacterized protein n=1 Tax=Scleroderma citrinum Foug A TaxID=1036808 RepID=A0A0C3DXW7_9AGAM|nr:hypothetical protein SCLCIDRAFT_1212153 [Scleroderma citrinum Foug A]
MCTPAAKGHVSATRFHTKIRSPSALLLSAGCMWMIPLSRNQTMDRNDHHDAGLYRTWFSFATRQS